MKPTRNKDRKKNTEMVKGRWLSILGTNRYSQAYLDYNVSIEW
jgi:hypothetical protein